VRFSPPAGRGGALVAVAVALAAMLLPSGAAAASAAGRWTPLNIRSREIADDYAVSCVTASACYLVGAEGNNAFMRFDGRRLRALPSPPFGPYVNSDLEDLACTSTRFCMAVGDRGGLPATADRWNGTRWSVLPVPVHLPARLRHPKAALSGLTSVSCPSSSTCLAVGGRFQFGVHRQFTQASMAARWDGTRWTTFKVPVTHAVLLSVACTSTDDCVAIGGRVGRHLRSEARPISIRLHDGRWSPLTFRTPRGAIQIEANSISCPVPGGCVAVGSATRTVTRTGQRRRLQRALVLRQRGDTWVARTLPVSRSVSRLTRGPSVQSLTTVSCPPGVAAGCVAVGTWGTAPRTPTPKAGTLWATLAPGHPHVSTLMTENDLSTLSCPTAQFCLGAGNESVARLHHNGFSGSFFGG
jgi:hypothetical protein